MNPFSPKDNPPDLTILLEAIQSAVDMGWIPAMNTGKEYLKTWAGMESILQNAFDSREKAKGKVSG